MHRQDSQLLVAALGVWIIASAIGLWLSPPLGHDEAAYVVGARQLWLGGEPVWLYRSVGTELLALPGIVFGGSELALRFTTAIMTLTVPLGAYTLARVAFDRRIAGWWLPLCRPESGWGSRAGRTHRAGLPR